MGLAAKLPEEPTGCPGELWGVPVVSASSLQGMSAWT
jgi:hypothetical protein